MRIELRYFASVREAIGLSHESIELPAAKATVGDVRRSLMARGGAWAQALDDRRALRMAFDQKMANENTPVADGGEVAFFPPVTGG